jgi:hypothetical protein
VRRLLKACTPGHAMPRQRVSTSQTPEYHNPSPWTVDLSTRSHIQRIGWVYLTSRRISLTFFTYLSVLMTPADAIPKASVGVEGPVRPVTVLGSILWCSQSGDPSIGRFSQIWLKAKYESKKP